MAGVQEGGTETFNGSADSGGVIKYVWVSDAQDTALNVELYASFGAPTAPGTYDIDATEADYATCGICLLVFGDSGATTYMPVADSGSITLDDYTIASPVGTTFSGSFDVEMQEVTIADGTYATTPVEGGCAGTLTADFSGTVTDFPAK
ncbi:MAG TPA: hypothetical protein VM285_13735 [Polyangia bacterium]|nr:hypothetical protein [Polyangia bacterium]